MDAKLIEKLDRRRYNHTVWWTVGFTLLFAGLIVEPYLKGETASIINSYAKCLGAVVFLVTMIRSYRNEKIIKSVPALQAALDNEMVVFYRSKANKITLLVTIVATLLLYVVSDSISGLTAHFACLLIMSVTGLTLLIAQLVYMRR